MSKLTAREGDTFANISRRAFGTETKAQALRRVNPGVSEPLAAGVVVTVPQIPGAPIDKTSATAGRDDVVVVVGGGRFSEWESVTITLSIDRPPEMTLFSPWDPDAAEMRRVFRPFSFNPLVVSIGPDPLFTGVMLAPSPSTTSEGSTVTASAYGATGTAYDCAAPASAYPLEFDNLTLDAIATQLLAPFGIAATFTAPVGAPFERVSMDPTEPVMGFLAGLAKQRNIVIGETAQGAALFQQSVEAGSPVAVMKGSQPPASAVATSFNGQAVFSDITAIAPTVPGLEGGQSTAKNTQLTGVVRPHTFTAPDTTPEGGQSAAEAKLGRMYANAVSWNVPVPSWRGPSGAVWQPNTTIKLTAPNAMIYSETEFLIKEVRLSTGRESRTALLTVVLPGAYSGQAPETLPWE